MASGLDIFALAGGDLKAYVKELVGTADGAGTIVASILGDATKTLVNPFLNAIEVLIARYRINSGGVQQGAFVADEFVTSTGTLTNASTASTVSLTGVSDPAPEAVYQDMVFVGGTIGPLVYTIPNLTPGANYRIRLHFTTFTDGAAGQRLLSVSVNGNSLISALDVYATAGGDLKALIEEVNANADGTGTLTITITADQTKTIKNPFVNGLEIRSNGVTYLAYDQNGNLLTETAWTGITTNLWNTENRLLSVNAGLNGTETYAYSADGLRQQKVTAAGIVNFVWDGQNLLQERDASQVKLAQYTDYPGYWGGLVSQRRGTVSSFYGCDSQASTRILVSIAGVITDQYGSRVFGEPLSQGGGTTNPYRYVGQLGYYFDATMRLYVRRRVDNPMLGRWASRDAYATSATNLYLYAENNPVNLTDPSGLDVSIGPVPPGTSCDGADAVTGCNFAKGQPFTLICNTPCDAPCTDAHEGQHRYDISSCCAKASKCYNAAKNAAGRQLCLILFGAWAEAERASTECQAYRSGRLCRQHMAKCHDCYGAGAGSACCTDIQKGIDRDDDQIAKTCGGVGWPRLPQPKCPF